MGTRHPESVDAMVGSVCKTHPWGCELTPGQGGIPTAERGGLEAGRWIRWISRKSRLLKWESELCWCQFLMGFAFLGMPGTCSRWLLQMRVCVRR